MFHVLPFSLANIKRRKYTLLFRYITLGTRRITVMKLDDTASGKVIRLKKKKRNASTHFEKCEIKIITDRGN